MRECIDEICGHMTFCNKYWTKESLVGEALKYRTRSEFRMGSNSAYQTSIKRGLIEEICGHMRKRAIYNTKWTIEKLSEEALKYRTRREFQKASACAYSIAFKRKIIDEICGHMEKGASGFDRNKNSIIYNFSCLGIGLGSAVHKIGISNRTAHDRSSGYGILDGYEVTLRSVVNFEDGRLCFDVEKYMKKRYRDWKYEVDYDGPAFLKNGMSEVFTRDIFADWLESEHGRETLKTPGVTVERIGV